MTATSPGLQQLRKTKGLSAKLAKHLSISRQAVSDWKRVPIDLLIKVEDFTGIPREKLRPELFRKKIK